MGIGKQDAIEAHKRYSPVGSLWRVIGLGETSLAQDTKQINTQAEARQPGGECRSHQVSKWEASSYGPAVSKVYVDEEPNHDVSQCYVCPD